ncbi:unnamed protein product [Symbiodinium sp. CCMP2592]|nr:unnamed protein product [Symbiodinium sp. CCMP2592]
MVYCLDNAEAGVEAMARRLLSVPRGITTDAAIIRLHMVSDILHNSAQPSVSAQIAEFRSTLQELLPETFEKLGRLWLQKLASPEEKERGESALLRVLEVWKDTQIFPPLFTKGLLCLAQAPILDVSAKEANAEPDEQLKQKLVRWFSGLNQARSGRPHARDQPEYLPSPTLRFRALLASPRGCCCSSWGATCGSTIEWTAWHLGAVGSLFPPVEGAADIHRRDQVREARKPGHGGGACGEQRTEQKRYRTGRERRVPCHGDVGWGARYGRGVGGCRSSRGCRTGCAAGEVCAAAKAPSLEVA